LLSLDKRRRTLFSDVAHSITKRKAMMRLAVFLLLPMALSMKTDAPHHTMTLAVAGSKVEAVTEMERMFTRSEEAHQHSMDEIAKTLTFSKAMEVIQHSTLPAATSAFTKVTNLLAGSQNLRSKTKDDGFGGLDGARRLLNSMIHEAMTKYDAEIAKCTDYYAKQCALMEIARGQISAANFIAASSRGLILDAQGVINQMEKDIPATKKELKDHNSKCKGELLAMDKRLKVLMGDIAVMTMILKMSDCDAKGFVQMQKLAMLKCQDQCSNKDVVTFNHNSCRVRWTSCNPLCPRTSWRKPLQTCLMVLSQMTRWSLCRLTALSTRRL